MLPVTVKAWSMLVALWGITTLVVAHKWLNGMVYDDQYVIAGPLIHHVERLYEVFGAHAMLAQGDEAVTAMDTYRPVSIASFFWDAWLSGTDTWSYHLTNHLAHLASVGFLFALARTMIPAASLEVVAFSCLFFALSPHLAEGHIWINGRSDPLATAFGLASILVWRDALVSLGTHRHAKHALCGLLFLLGLLCKEVLLLVVPALFLWPESAPARLTTRLMRLVPFAIASLTYLALRMNALHGMRTSRDTEHLRRALVNLPILWIDGLSELLVPTKLYLRSMRDEYATLDPTRYAVICAIVVLLFVLGWRLRKRSPILVWSLVWFTGTLAPVALVTVLLWPGFGRYLYLPCAGLALGVCELTWQAQQAISRRQSDGRLTQARAMLACRGAGVIYLVSFAVQLALVTGDYRSNATLYPAIILAAPQSPHGYGWVGLAIAESGSLKEARQYLTRALELGGFEPRYARALTRVNLLLGDKSAAADLARDALKQPRLDRADSEAFRGMLSEALANERAPAP